MEGCNNFYVSGCDAEADALVRCLDENYDRRCYLSHQCDAELDAWSICFSYVHQCSPTGPCPSSDDACACSKACPENIELEQACTATADGIECTCRMNGEVAGTCFQRELTCEIEVGCCVEVFEFF
jgi:hypothetical protein